MSPALVSGLLTAGISLLAFGAVYWPEPLGTLGASPGLPLILLAVVLAPFARPHRLEIFQRLKLQRLLWAPVAGSAIAVFAFGWNPVYAGKFVTIGLLSLLWLSPLLLADFLVMKHVKVACLAGIAICTFGFVLSDVLGVLPDALRHIVFGTDYLQFDDARPRGFSEEPSQFSATFSRLLVVYYLIWESRHSYRPQRLIGFLVALAMLLVILGSKGAVSGVALAVLSFSIGRRQLPYLVLALPLAWWLGSQQLDVISVDLEQFSSTSTRLTLSLTGLVATAVNPIGWGYYGFYGAMQSFGGWSLDWISDRFPLLLGEARSVIEDLSNVSTKSTMLDFTMVFGWLFIWLMISIVRAIRFKDPRVRACWVFIMASSLSTSGHMSITMFLALSVMLRLYPRDVSHPTSALAPSSKLIDRPQVV